MKRLISEPEWPLSLVSQASRRRSFRLLSIGANRSSRCENNGRFRRVSPAGCAGQRQHQLEPEQYTPLSASRRKSGGTRPFSFRGLLRACSRAAAASQRRDAWLSPCAHSTARFRLQRQRHATDTASPSGMAGSPRASLRVRRRGVLRDGRRSAGVAPAGRGGAGSSLNWPAASPLRFVGGAISSSVAASGVMGRAAVMLPASGGNLSYRISALLL